jgi:beta-glucanase (GH16 family)
MKTNTPNPGVVATFIGISNVLDEIDFEFVTGVPGQEAQAQANWYFHGWRDHDKGFGQGDVTGTVFDSFHNYRVDWNAERIIWTVDGDEINRLVKADMGDQAYRFPSTPMRISFGIWFEIISLTF